MVSLFIVGLCFLIFGVCTFLGILSSDCQRPNSGRSPPTGLSNRGWGSRTPYVRCKIEPNKKRALLRALY